MLNASLAASLGLDLTTMPTVPVCGIGGTARVSTERRAQVIGCLVEGNSIRATARLTGAAKNTVTKLLVDLGHACEAYQAEHMVDLASERIQCDEIWSFCYSKAKNIPEEHRGEWGYRRRVDVDRHRRGLQARPGLVRRWPHGRGRLRLHDGRCRPAGAACPADH